MKRFQSLIQSMPIDEQAFRSKKSSWKKDIAESNELAHIFKDIFGDNESIFFSRKDVFKASKQTDLKCFAIIVLLWGYPRGMRGKNFEFILPNLDEIIEVLEKARTGIQDWNKHYSQIKEIKGLGLSTYSKFLYFLKIEVEGYPALILDQKISKTLKNCLFSELEALNTINPNNADIHYVNYLKEMQALSLKLGIQSDKIEIFLFEFGLNLKI